MKGAIGWWRYYVNLGGSLAGLNEVTGMNSLMAHEESFFYLGIMLLVAVQFLYGAPRGQRIATLAARAARARAVPGQPATRRLACPDHLLCRCSAS